LFSYPPATGVKTGSTPAAGETLVSSAADRDEAYVCVVLGANEDRFAASGALEYGFAAYDRLDRVVEGRRYAGVDVPYRRGETIDLVAEHGVEGLVDASPRVELDTDLTGELPDSARAGTRLGEVDGKKIGETALVARTGYKEASLGDRVWYTVEGIFAEEK